MKKRHHINLNDLSDTIANEFYREFTNKFPDIKHELIKNNKLSSQYYTTIRIPSLNNDFWDIEVLIWCREITVYIGDKFHTHFEMDISLKDSTINDSKEVICEVIDFLQDIISEKILLRVRIKGKKIITSSIVYAEDKDEPIESMGKLGGLIKNIFPTESKTFLYSWSGKQIDVK